MRELREHEADVSLALGEQTGAIESDAGFVAQHELDLRTRRRDGELRDVDVDAFADDPRGWIGGAALRPLLIAGGTARFYLLFGIAFLLYAVGWVAAYFTLRDGFGEWVASFAGSALMAVAFAWAFGAWRSLLKLIVVIFIANSAGYFLGSLINSALRGRVGMVIWGLLFGLGLGAGLGYAIYESQSEARARLSS